MNLCIIIGLSRDKRHKRRATGGRRAIHIKKRKYEMARPPSMTKIGAKRVKVVRVRGGNYKYRAMRLEFGNFSWGSEAIAKKTKILDVIHISFRTSEHPLISVWLSSGKLQRI